MSDIIRTPRTPGEAAARAVDLMASFDDDFRAIFGAKIESAAGAARPLTHADLERSFCYGAPPPADY